MGSEAGGAGIAQWADVFIEFADTLVDDYDVVELAEQLIDRLMELLPIAAAGMLLGDENAKLSVFAASSEHARLLELLQVDNNVGPCLLAYTSGEQVIVDDLNADSARWPGFSGQAREFGFGSVYSLPMRLREERFGSLNLFCREGQVLSSEEIAVGQALADLAVIGIGGHRVLARAEAVTRQLQTALTSRVVIEQAQGILAERGKIDMDRASDLLRAHARNTGERLADVAGKIVAGESIVIVEELHAAQEARRQQAKADERFRRSMSHAAIGMCLVAPDGRFEEVNDALCQLFGYDAETLMQKTWQEVTAPAYLQAHLRNFNDVLEGRIDAYRGVKEYLHADGHRIWGDLAVSCIRDEDGQVENLIAQIADITARVQADERNRVLAQQLQQKTDLMKAELDTASAYMSSIMPQGLDGPVVVSSRYLPSRALGGDCFNYHWIDEDHFFVKLIDVSGHGIEPALLAVSIHNLLRSGTLTTETLLAPEALLTELNRLFQMDLQKDHYFTIWYGVYEMSSRTLRYASAGMPPAFAYTYEGETAVATTELFTQAVPVGVFEDTVYISDTFSVPHGCQILICSDGASEITLDDHEQLSWADFANLTARLAQSPDWTLDDLVDQLRALTPSGVFEDDCSLIQLKFD